MREKILKGVAVIYSLLGFIIVGISFSFLDRDFIMIQFISNIGIPQESAKFLGLIFIMFFFIITIELVWALVGRIEREKNIT